MTVSDGVLTIECLAFDQPRRGGEAKHKVTPPITFQLLSPPSLFYMQQHSGL